MKHGKEWMLSTESFDVFQALVICIFPASRLYIADNRPAWRRQKVPGNRNMSWKQLVVKDDMNTCERSTIDAFPSPTTRVLAATSPVPVLICNRGVVLCLGGWHELEMALL